MARDFELGNPDWTQWSGTPGVTTYPATFSCWMNAETSLDYMYGLWMGWPSGANQQIGIGLAATGAAFMIVYVSAGFTLTPSSTTVGDGVWAHVCGVFTGAADRDVYLNGAGKASSAVSRAWPSSISIIAHGMARDSSPAFPMDGGVAEPAIWNVALALDEVQALARGMSPLRVRPSGLVHYWPLRHSDRDMIGAADMTPNGSPSWHPSHAPIRAMSGNTVFAGSAAAPPTGIVVLRRRRECA